jgi:surface protein
MSYGKIYETTWWGNPVSGGWGGIYYDLAEQAFIFTVKTDNSGTSNTDQFTLPLTDNGTVNIQVNWGDGTSDAITAFDQAEKTHTYPSAGTYEIKITGTLQGFRFNNTGDKSKMLDIKKWGIFDINTQQVFRSCGNLTQSATDTPIISTTNLLATFQACSVFNGDISSWDVSGATTFANFFYQAKLFNQDISSWDVSSATNLTSMFRDAEIFNKDISGWNVSNNNTFKEMFRETNDFNQPIGSWTIKNVVNQNINMQRMFRQATSFDQSLANWDMEQVNNLQDFLLNAGLSTANYDATLIGWAAQSLQSGLTCDFGNSQYTAGGAAEAARNTLINTYGWTITDGGAA